MTKCIVGLIEVQRVLHCLIIQVVIRSYDMYLMFLTLIHSTDMRFPVGKSKTVITMKWQKLLQMLSVIQPRVDLKA
ncbi:MAG: hypothetical protein U0M06_01355 [Clostridia bacterium]|nr:hypothetical protein [Clostridia bacterium]